MSLWIIYSEVSFHGFQFVLLERSYSILFHVLVIMGCKTGEFKLRVYLFLFLNYTVISTQFFCVFMHKFIAMLRLLINDMVKILGVVSSNRLFRRSSGCGQEITKPRSLRSTSTSICLIVQIGCYNIIIINCVIQLLIIVIRSHRLTFIVVDWAFVHVTAVDLKCIECTTTWLILIAILATLRIHTSNCFL